MSARNSWVLVALTALIAVPSAAQPRFDLNNDGKVSVADVTTILRTAIGLSPTSQTIVWEVDSNGDGKVTVADATSALRTAIGLVPTQLLTGTNPGLVQVPTLTKPVVNPSYQNGVVTVLVSTTSTTTRNFAILRDNMVIGNIVPQDGYGIYYDRGPFNKPDGRYDYTAQAYGDGLPSTSNVATIYITPQPTADITPPTIAQLTVQDIGSGQVQLNWTAPTDDRAVMSADITRNGQLIGNATGKTSFIEAPGFGTFTYQIRAYDAAGNVGKSPVASITFSPPQPTADTTPPTIPQNLHYNLVGSVVTLLWDYANDASGINSYKVYDGNAVIAIAYAPVAVANIANGNHSFSVSAVDNSPSQNESGHSAPVSVSVGGNPIPTPSQQLTTNDVRVSFSKDASGFTRGERYIQIDVTNVSGRIISPGTIPLVDLAAVNATVSSINNRVDARYRINGQLDGYYPVERYDDAAGTIQLRGQTDHVWAPGETLSFGVIYNGPTAPNDQAWTAVVRFTGSDLVTKTNIVEPRQSGDAKVASILRAGSDLSTSVEIWVPANRQVSIPVNLLMASPGNNQATHFNTSGSGFFLRMADDSSVVPVSDDLALPFNQLMLPGEGYTFSGNVSFTAPPRPAGTIVVASNLTFTTSTTDLGTPPGSANGGVNITLKY